VWGGSAAPGRLDDFLGSRDGAEWHGADVSSVSSLLGAAEGRGGGTCAPVCEVSGAAGCGVGQNGRRGLRNYAETG
jgi:hypothetical protein